MASEIRVNKIENRSGLGTVTFADTGVDLAGIVTATTFSGSGASLTNLPAANVTATLPAISGANLTNLPAANLTGTLPAISGANLTGIAATDNVRTGILDVAGIATFRNDVLVGSAVTLSESGVAAAGLAITCKSLNGQQFSHRNVWINGEFSVAQRGTEQTSITSLSGYATGGPDRCFIVISGHGTWTVKQGTDAPPGFQNCMEMIATTGDSSVGSSATVRWWQRFEGQNLQRFEKGTSSAKEFTLSFYIKSSTTGTYAFELLDYDSSNRHMVKTYTVDAADTWEYKTITFPADTTGEFDNDHNNSLAAEFWLVAGSDYTSGGTMTAWASLTNNKRAGGHTANAGASDNDYVRITGVQLEVGNQATEYEHKTYAEELAACQRYYYRHAFGSSEAGSANASNNNMAVGMCAMYTSSAGFGFIPFPVTMRTLPTLENATGTDYYRVYARGGADNFNDISTQQFGVNGAVINYYDGFARTQGDAGWIQCYDANAYIAFKAEL